MAIISQMGFVDYFLIVWDFIKYARDNDIIVGPGRQCSRQPGFLYPQHYSDRSAEVWIAV